MIISGAMAMLDKETLLKTGGYDVDSIGEDMEVVLRMRRYMVEKKEGYVVTYIPDPLCWTEVPEDYKSLRNQRTRWTKGLVDSLNKHATMFLNPKYKKLGMLGYPFWLFFEWLAPLMAFLGMIYTVYLIIDGSVYWKYLLLLYGFIYSFAILLTSWSVLFEELTFHKYAKKWDVVKLILVSFVEPFIYPLMAFFAIRGNFQFLFRNKHKWGEIKKNGNGHK